MKKLAIVLLAVLLAGAVWAEEPAPLVSVGGVTDGYIIFGEEGGTLTAGQDVNLDVGPFYADLTLDWTKTLWTGGNVLAFTYAVGYSQAFGIFTPAVKLTGDKSYDFPTKAWSGDLFSDIEPSLAIVYKAVGANLYSDLSVEKGYELLQTVDVSAFANVGPATFRVGFLYMDPQAVTDDVGYPNSPAAREGYSLYAKASVSY